MKTLLALCFALLLPLPPLAAQDPPPALEEAEELALAEAAEVKQLLAAYSSALKDGDAAKVRNALLSMCSYKNEEFMKPAIDTLRYKATKLDKKAAKEEAEELGLRSRKEIDELIEERVVMVQGTAVKLLSNFRENKKAINTLAKLFSDRKTRKERPKVHAAVIIGLGTMGYRKIERDVFNEFKAWAQPDVTRACCRYFGLIKTRDKSIVRTLCESLSAPEPGNVDDPNNPPASYWAARWQAWSVVRRDLTWTLKEITGQVFRPQEGDHPGDTQKALEYVKKHAKELGLK